MTKSKTYIILVIFGLLLSIGYCSDQVNKPFDNEKDISPTPRKMTFYTNKASLPPFLWDVWPPPGAEFSLEAYNNNISFHFDVIEKRDVGIGVQINHLFIDPPPASLSEDYILRAQFYIDGKDVQELKKKKEFCEQPARGVPDWYFNEQGARVGYFAGEILIICYPELTIGKHEIKFTIESLKGEVFEYAWEITVTGNLLVENLDVIYVILATGLIVILFVIYRRRNV